MFCIKCGTNLPEEAGFCIKCGTKTYKNDTHDNQSYQEIIEEINQPNDDIHQQIDNYQQVEDMQKLTGESIIDYNKQYYQNESSQQIIHSNQQNIYEQTQIQEDYDITQTEQEEYNQRSSEQIIQQESKQQIYNHQTRVKVIENFLSFETKNLLEQYGLNQVIFAKYAINNNTSLPCVGEITFFETGFAFNSGNLNLEKGTISFYYSDINQVESEPLPVGSIKITLKDNSVHTIAANQKKPLMKFLDYMKDSAQQMPFEPSEFIYDTSKLGEKPSDIWVWACCGIQVLSIIFSILISQDTSMTDFEILDTTRKFIFLIYSANCGACYMDGLSLKKRGISQVQTNWTWLVPVYLFKRAKTLGGDNIYAIVWCIIFVISLAF